MKTKNQTHRSVVHGIPVLVEQSFALPLVSLTVARRGGTVLDPEAREGISRIHSRLCRRTAGGRPFQSIEEELDRLGASLGSEASYSAISLGGVSITRSVDNYVALVADALGRPSLDLVEFERLRRETRAEIIEGQDNDRALAHRALRRALYPGHAYARTATGTLSSVERMTHDDVLSHHSRLHNRADLVVGLSGDIEIERATQIAERVIAAIPDGLSMDARLDDPVVPEGRRLVIVDKPDRAQTQILVGLAGTKPTDDDHAALHVAMTVFGGTFSSRLMQQIRVERGWSYGAYASLAIDRYRQALTLWTFPSKVDAAACARLKLDLLEALVDKGITSKELSFAKKSLIRSHAFSIDTAAKRLGLLLDAALVDLPEGYYEEYEKRIAGVTLEQTAAALRQRIDPSRLVIAVVGSAKELEPQLVKAISGITSVNIVDHASPEL